MTNSKLQVNPKEARSYKLKASSGYAAMFSFLIIVIDPLVQSLQDKIDFEVKNETQFSKISFDRTFLGTIDAKNMKMGVISVTENGIYYLYVQRLNPSSLRNALLQQIETVQIKDGLAEISLGRDWKASVIISVLTLFISFCVFTRIWDW